jgi:hydroxymethylglutaryl-CoA reductase
MTEEYLLEIMSWMMSEIIIEDEKIIYNINCKLWNKKKDIIECLKDIPDTLTTCLEKYKFYVKVNKEKGKLTANKHYFEQILNTIDI